MSSGFVSGGTTEQPSERNDEWLRAQQEIETNRQRKEEEGRQQGGRSLYEVLQNNKAAKQEAFEESIRLKNQFRTLDEDEVEFLDSVLESTRAKEDAVKKETTEQLELFRRQREEVDKALLGDTWTEPVASHRPDSPSEPHLAESQWTINARKRKRARDNEVVPGIKLRKSSSTSKEPTSALPGGTAAPAGEISPKDTSPPGKTNGLGDNPQDPVHGEGSFLGGKQTTLPSASAKPKIGALGLAAYSSDEDD